MNIPPRTDPPTAPPLFSVVITTRNRREELLRALKSCVAQNYHPLEILVFDDASTDGSCEAIRERFPEVRAFRSDTHVERLVLRNRAYREAKGKYIFTLDDDCYFTDKNTLSDAADLFESSDSVGAVATRFIEPSRTFPQDWPYLSTARGDQLASFVGCSNALRREAVLSVGGYREILVHYKEEGDLCLRLLNQGWVVLSGGSAPMVHLPSLVRDPGRIWLYSVRNTILVTFLNAPAAFVLPQIVTACFRMMFYRLRLQTVFVKLRGIVLGFKACVRFKADRNPISLATYLKYRRLPGHGPERWTEAWIPEPARRDPSV